LSLTVSGIAGPEEPNDDHDQRYSFDVTGLTKLVPHLDINFQINAGTERHAALDGGLAKWYGFGVQPVLHFAFSEKFTVGARIELFDDPDGARTGVKQR